MQQTDSKNSDTGIPIHQWTAERLNLLFAEKGQTGMAGKITAETVAHGLKVWFSDRSPMESLHYVNDLS